MTNTGDWNERIQRCFAAITACDIAIEELRRQQRQQLEALRGLLAALEGGGQ